MYVGVGVGVAVAVGMYACGDVVLGMAGCVCGYVCICWGVHWGWHPEPHAYELKV